MISKFHLRLWLLSSFALCLVSTGAVAAFYIGLNWLGKKEWTALVRDLQAREEPATWRDVVPPPIPDPDNFCAIPFFACLFDYIQVEGVSDPIYKDPIAVEKSRSLKLLDPALPDFPLRGSRTKNTLTDLRAWQSYYQKSLLFPQPPPSGKTSPGASVLRALELYQPQLTEILAASRRPSARFPVHYKEEPKFSISQQHFGVSLDLSNLFSLRALAYLDAGQSAKAWADLRVLLKLHQACEKEPTLISHLVGATLAGTMLDTIWEGLARDAWSDQELQEISISLAQLDFLNEYQQCMRGETMFYAIPLLDYMETKRGSAFAALANLGAGKSNSIIFQLIPKGGYDLAKVATVNLLYDRILPLVDAQNHRYSFATATLLESEGRALKFYSPRTLMIKVFTSNSRAIAQKMVEIQADVDMARIACVLELFHRQTGHYPPSLASLKDPLPFDIINGKPYGYTLTSEGRYRIWSVGWDQVDDSGRVVYRDQDKKRWNRNQGDWVWAYPSKTSDF